MNDAVKISVVAFGIIFCVLVFQASGQALDCGRFVYPQCNGPDFQYAGGFNPQTGYGGFGGGSCRARRTPVIFIHGNADRATGWDSPVTGSVGNFVLPARSVYEEFKDRDYKDCELFGITYLSAEERQHPQTNYHQPSKFEILISFIEAVKAYTGMEKVDIVAHSMGVSMALAALTYADHVHPGKKGWAGVRRFVNIAGGIRGLPACLRAGFINPFVSTCGSQHFFNDYIFGFYPDSGGWFGGNDWTGGRGPLSLRLMPGRHPEVLFYTLTAGEYDQILCPATETSQACARVALFVKKANVRSQLDVGAGSRAAEDGGGDADGVGHFKARNNTGAIIFEMLDTNCTGLACKGTYKGGPVRVEAEQE